MAALMRLPRLVNFNVFKRSIHTTNALKPGICRRILAERAIGIRIHAYPSFLWRHLSTKAEEASRRGDEIARRRWVTNQKPVRHVPKPSEVDNALSGLDAEVKRFGKIDVWQIHRVLAMLRKTEAVTGEQALMLLRSTGSVLMSEKPERRRRLMAEVRQQLKDLDAVLNISHFNAVLHVQLQNEEQFDPAEALAELENDLHLFPNRITYQLLVSRYCEIGDVEGATKILEHMKTEEMPVNETVFNSLIKGHMIKGDVAGAKQVMTAMREAGLEPSSTTYKTLLCCFAQRGDMDAMKEMIAEADTEEIVFHKRQLCDVAVSLVNGGHEDLLAEVMEVTGLVQKAGQNFDVLNGVLQMLVMGHDDAALTMYTLMERRDNVEHGKSILKAMVKIGRPMEKVFEVRDKFSKEGEPVVGLSELARWAVMFQQPDHALALYKSMADEGEEVSNAMFWPLFRLQEVLKNTEGVYKTIQAIFTVKSYRADAIATVVNNGLRALHVCGENIDAALVKLKDEYGVKEDVIEKVRLSHLVEEGRFTEAVQMMDTGSTELLVGQRTLKVLAVNGFDKSLDVNGLIQLLQKHAERYTNDITEIQSTIFLSVVRNHIDQPDMIRYLLDLWLEQEMPILQSASEHLKKIYAKLWVPDEKIQKLEGLEKEANSGLSREDFTRENLMKRTTRELELLLEDTQRRRGHTRSIEMHLLHKYCLKGNVEGAEKTKAALDDQGFVYRAESFRHMGVLAAKVKRNLTEALKYKQLLRTQYPSYGAYSPLVLSIAALQIRTGDLEDAKASLTEYADLHKGNCANLNDATRADQCGVLLDACLETQSPSVVREVVDLLFELEFVKRGAFDVLGFPIQAYLKAEDHEGLVTALEHCVTEYHRAPHFSDIFKALIHTEDAERLQKAVDLVTTLKGDMEVMLHLVVCFIECDKLKQARKIIESPGLRAINHVMKESAERLVNTSKVKELEQFVQLTKNLFAVDRDEMLFQLIRAHSRNKDFKNCMDVYAMYEEEAKRPRDRTLRFLAKVLRSHDQPVPFEVPDVMQHEPRLEAREEPAGSSTEAENEAAKAIQLGDLDKFMQIHQSAVEEGQPLSQSFLIQSALSMLHQKKFKEFKGLVYQLGELGELETLLSLRQGLSIRMQQFTNRMVFRAYIISGRVDELLDILLENPATVAMYSSTDNIEMLQERQPESVSKFVEAIEKYTEVKDSLRLLGHLLSHHILREDFDQVDSLVKKYPNLLSKFSLSFICRKAGKEGKEAVLQKLLSLLRENVESKNPLAFVYSWCIMMKCNEGDWQAGLEYYQQSQEEGNAIDTMWAAPLLLLEKLLMDNNKPLPWPEGTVKAKGDADEYSPSSSSSSSDASSDQTVHDKGL